MTPLQETLLALKEAGFILHREGKKHTIYYNPHTHQTIPVKRHDFNDNDKKYILKEAGIRK